MVTGMNRTFCARVVVMVWLCLLVLAGCHRAPQTSAELRKGLPRQFTGEIYVQGQSEPLRLRITPHDFTERDSRVLEFGGVRYAVLDARGGVQSEGDASLTGTITLPGLEVRLEGAGNLGEGGDFVKAGTFQGKLSEDLQTGEASWTTGYGQAGRLKVEAVK